MIGELTYLGWAREWRLRLEGQAAPIDIKPDFWRVAAALNNVPTRFSYGREEIEIAADISSEFNLEFKELGSGVAVFKRDGFGFSNVAAYFDQQMQNMNARRVEITIGSKAFKISARDEADVPGVYYSEINMAAIPEGDERSICRIGKGADCCVFAVISGAGFSCAKFSGGMGRQLLERFAAGGMKAGRIGNCRIAGRIASTIEGGERHVF